MFPPRTPKQNAPTCRDTSRASLQACVAGGGLWLTTMGIKSWIADFSFVTKTLGGPKDNFQIIARTSGGSFINWGKLGVLGLVVVDADKAGKAVAVPICARRCNI